MTTEISKYQKQASDFAKKHNVKMTVKYFKFDFHFADDKQERHIFKVTLKRNGKSYSFKFGQSIASGSKEPNLYDVLACLQNYEVGSLGDFCSEFGYSCFNEYTGKPDKKIENLYKRVCKEFENVNRLFNDVMEELVEIQ